MRRGSVDLASLVAGLAIAALGGLLLADRTGAVDVRFAAFGPAVLATLGAILIAVGLGRAR